VVRCGIPTSLVETLVRIEVTFRIVAACVVEVERPLFRVVVVTHASWTACEILVVVSFDDHVRRLSC